MTWLNLVKVYWVVTETSYFPWHTGQCHCSFDLWRHTSGTFTHSVWNQSLQVVHSTIRFPLSGRWQMQNSSMCVIWGWEGPCTFFSYAVKRERENPAQHSHESVFFPCCLHVHNSAWIYTIAESSGIGQCKQTTVMFTALPLNILQLDGNSRCLTLQNVSNNMLIVWGQGTMEAVIYIDCKWPIVDTVVLWSPFSCQICTKSLGCGVKANFCSTDMGVLL